MIVSKCVSPPIHTEPTLLREQALDPEANPYSPCTVTLTSEPDDGTDLQGPHQILSFKNLDLPVHLWVWLGLSQTQKNQRQ